MLVSVAVGMCWAPLIWTYNKRHSKFIVILPRTLQKPVTWSESWILEKAPNDLCVVTSSAFGTYGVIIWQGPASWLLSVIGKKHQTWGTRPIQEQHNNKPRTANSKFISTQLWVEDFGLYQEKAVQLCPNEFGRVISNMGHVFTRICFVKGDRWREKVRRSTLVCKDQKLFTVVSGSSWTTVSFQYQPWLEELIQALWDKTWAAHWLFSQRCLWLFSVTLCWGQFMLLGCQFVSIPGRTWVESAPFSTSESY
jgi:hypothetical protein